MPGGMLLAGAVARRGLAQEVRAERERRPSRAASSAAVSTAHPYGLAVWASSHRAISCGAAARVWVSPYPVVLSATLSRGSRAAAVRARFCSARLNAGPMRITVAKSSTSRSRACGSAPRGAGTDGIGGIPVRPQRTDDHHLVQGRKQRPHHAAGQPVFAVQVALQLDPATPASALAAPAPARRAGPGPAGCTSHQSGSSALTVSTALRVLPTEDPPTSSTNPPGPTAAATAARTRASASRATHSGGTSSGTPRTLTAACTPQPP